jgi:hypothetical protein
MKNLIFVISSSLVIAACATTSAVLPKWINEKGMFMRDTDALKNCIGEVGSYKIGARGEGFARNQSGAAARSQLAQQISTTISSEVKSYFEETQTANGSYAEGTASDVSKAIADNVKLKGSEIFSAYVYSEQRTVYALAVLCMDGSALDKIVENAASAANLKSGDVEAVKARARKAFSGRR